MIVIYIRILIWTLLLLCSNATPIKKLMTVGPSHQLDEFIDGEVVCTGHILEDNFEDNLASAASRCAHQTPEMDEICLAELGLYTNYHNPAAGTEGNTMIYACTYGAVASCNSIRFFEINPRFDEVCPGQGAWMYNETNSASYGRDPAKTVECYT